MIVFPGPAEIGILSMWLMMGFGSAGLPLGLPPAEQDPLLAAVAPEDCVFYASWAGVAKPDPASSNRTEQLLAEPEVQFFISEGVKRIESAIKEAAAEEGSDEAAMAGDAIRWAKALLTRSAAFYVSRAGMTPQGPAIEGAVLINVGVSAPDLRQTLEKYQGMFPAGTAQPVKIGSDSWHRLKLHPQAPAITWGTKGKYLIVGVGEGAIEGVLQRAYTPPPRWLTDLRKRLAVQRESTISYVDLKTIITTFGPLGGPQVSRIIDALGLSGLTSLASVTGLDEQGFVNKTLVGIEGKPSGIIVLAEGEPLTADDIAAIPRDATFAAAFRLDANRVLETIASVVGTVEPQARGQMEEGLSMLAQQTGIDLRNDVLQPLGDVWCVYNSPSEGGLILTGLTAVVKVDDVERMKQTHQKLQAMLQALSQAQAERGYGPRPKIDIIEFAEEEIYVLDTGEDEFPLVPSWCLTDGELILALFPQNIKAYLARSDDFQSLAAVPEVAGLFAADHLPMVVTYADTPAMFEMFYPVLQMVLQLAVTQLQRQGVDIDLSILPSAGSIRKHLRPTVGAVRRTEDGVESISLQTLPGGNVGASAPIAVALLLPAVQSARQAARRVQSTNNMKQIGIALHNYHDVHKHFPAAYSTDEEGKPLLSWRVQILPYVESNSLYNQFHLDEPWDSEHNRKLIAQMPRVYLSPDGAGEPGKTNYLGAGAEDGIFQGKDPVSFAQIRDGTSNTIATVEANNQSAVIWTKPEDYVPDPSNPAKGLVGLRPDGFNVGFADGSVQFLQEWIDPDTLNALFTRDGGEPVDYSDFTPSGSRNRARRFGAGSAGPAPGP
jgi:prepilin-type processing-associated H-X9-DG protein